MRGEGERQRGGGGDIQERGDIAVQGWPLNP